jgi:hypothetical protein
MSANTDPRGLGVSRDTIRRWQDLGLIVPSPAAVSAERANVEVDQGHGRSQLGGFPPVVEIRLHTMNVEPDDRSSAK